MIKNVIPGMRRGTILVPPSKSDSQRAIVAAALVSGTSEVYNVGVSKDEVAMLRNVSALGAEINESNHKTLITGIAQFPDEIELNIGESGLGLRLLAAICAAHEGTHTIIGEGSILGRPQGFFEKHLTQMGVKVDSNGGFLPLKVSGKLSGGNIEIDGSMSSQFLSGLLMALPLLDVDSTIRVSNLKSIPYVQMTLNTLKTYGIQIEHRAFEEFRIAGGQRYQSVKYAVESDWSSASCWLTAAAIGHQINLVGLTLESVQADIAMLEALTAANCAVVADESGIKVDGSNRKAFQFDATHCPDLFPALVALAAFCDGTTVIKGVSRLKNKESDRGLVLQSEFAKLGLKIELDEDRMHIHGGSKLNSAQVSSNNDHRIAMCVAIAGLNIEGGVEINDAEAVAKSYPEFWSHLEALHFSS